MLHPGGVGLCLSAAVYLCIVFCTGRASVLSTIRIGVCLMSATFTCIKVSKVENLLQPSPLPKIKRTYFIQG